MCVSIKNKNNYIYLPFTECCNESSTVDDIEEDDSADTLAEDAAVLSVEGAEDATVTSVEGGGRGAKV